MDFVLTLPFSVEPESARPGGEPDGGEQVCRVSYGNPYGAWRILKGPGDS